MKRIAFALLILAAASGLVVAQWGGGNCVVTQTAQYQWHAFVTDPGKLHLYLGQDQVGALDLATNSYRPLLDYQHSVWGPVCQPPVGVPQRTPAPGQLFEQDVQNFGVDRTKLCQDADGCYRINGQKVSKEQLYQALQSGLSDDAGKLRLTVIGSPAETATVLADLEADPEFKNNIHVWCAGPDDWSLKDAVTGESMFQTSGKPTVYLQSPDGTVLHRQDGYTKGDISALRKVRPYDPKKDPDVRKPSTPAGLGLPLPLLLMAAGLAFLIFQSKGA